jgi:cysteine synthase A
MIYANMFEASCVPKLFYPCREDRPNLIGIGFEFMKRIPAQFCVERALTPMPPQTLDAQGSFVPIPSGGEDTPEADTMVTLASEHNGERTLFIETSSGNMATGLAEVCQDYEIPLYLLLPSEVDEGTRRSLRELGAKIEVIDTMEQTVRIQRLAEVKQTYEAEGWNVWWVQQYTNPNNRISYWRLAEFLASEFDRIDQLVAPVGTGGSSCGTAGYLRRAGFPDLKLVGVDACGSVNFNHAPSDFLMGGIGSTRPMPLVDHSAYDTVHWVDDTTAFAASIKLFNSGVPVGGSSGAAFVAARYEAQKAPRDLVLVILPDHARRYADTIRSEEWRRANDVDLSRARKRPVQVNHPHKSDPSQPGVKPGWYRINWRAYYADKGGSGPPVSNAS